MSCFHLFGKRFRRSLHIFPVTSPVSQISVSCACFARTLCRVLEGEELSTGDRVWIPDLKAEGTLIKQHESPRSVVIQTPNGQVRRNRRMTRRVLGGRPPVSHQNEGYESWEPTSTREMSPDVPSAPGASQGDYGELPVPENLPAVNEPLRPGGLLTRLRPRGALRGPEKQC